MKNCIVFAIKKLGKCTAAKNILSFVGQHGIIALNPFAVYLGTA